MQADFEEAQGSKLRGVVVNWLEIFFQKGSTFRNELNWKDWSTEYWKQGFLSCLFTGLSHFQRMEDLQHRVVLHVFFFFFLRMEVAWQQIFWWKKSHWAPLDAADFPGDSSPRALERYHFCGRVPLWKDRMTDILWSHGNMVSHSDSAHNTLGKGTISEECARAMSLCNTVLVEHQFYQGDFWSLTARFKIFETAWN